MRKEAGFEVLDRINVYYEGVQAGKAGYSKEWNINGEKVTLSVEKR